MDGRVGLPNGTLLDGSYRIERVIGSGGFGITYEAEDVKLGTRVAIKEYCPEEFGYRDATLSVRPKSEQHTKTFEWGRSSFLQEARTLARFRHPSVVQVTRAFEAFSTAYMVMVFEQGQSLEQWLKRLGRPPTQEELDRIAGPILDALEMMHGESFLHRDIAPDNIIMRADGSPVLLDFGAARRAVAEESRSLTGIVKSGYSPQEQYATDGRLQGPWTDIYAFGATLYRAVTGKVPEESTLRAIDDRMLSAVSVGDRKYRPGFLEAIDACLEVHHADRPQSVTQVRSVLLTQPAREIPPPAHVVTAPLVKIQKTGTTKPTRVPPAQRSTKSWWAVAAAIAVVGVGVAGGLQYTRWQEAKRVADAEAAEKKTEEDVANKAVEEREHREAEAKRFQEKSRRASEAAQRDERAQQQRREEEGKRKAETEAVFKAPAPLKPSNAPKESNRDEVRPLTTVEEERITPGQEIQECQDCPRMLVVPAGSFMMGSPSSEPQRSVDEAQVHATIARPFAVGKFAVTFDEWDACVAAGGCNNYRPGDGGWGRGKRPVIYVNWDDAKAYATWLSRKTGKTYRLPSEAEREYVARAGTTTPFWWGSSITPQQANYDGSGEPYEGGGSKGKYRQHTVPVDSFESNLWGLYDVHGNIWEWTEDCWNDSNTGNPGNGSARTTGDCSRRVLRGGSWFNVSQGLRAANRSRSSTVFRSIFDGFRLARTISTELNQGQVKEATEAWGAVKDTTSISALEAFIARFPDSFYADLARTRIAELRKQVAPGAPPKVSDDLAALNRRISELYGAGKYGEAIPLSEKSLELTRSQKGEDHVDTAARMNWLALLYRAQGRYAEAEPLHKRALAISEKAVGPDHPDVGIRLNNLAELYRAQGRYAEVEPLYKRALAIAEKALGPDHRAVGTYLSNLALLYSAQGRTTEAEPLHKRALAISEKALGPDHPDVGFRLNNLAELYRAQGRYAEAEPLYKRALAVAEKAVGPDHPSVGIYLNNLALLYRVQGRYAEAEPLYKRALAITEKALGPDHPDVGNRLNNLAELYRVQGRYAQAEPLHKRALAISEKALGPDHPDVGIRLNNLALLYRARGRYAEAEPLHKRALAITEKALGPDHPSVGIRLNNLAALYRAQGRYAEAEPLHKRALAIAEKARARQR